MDLETTDSTPISRRSLVSKVTEISHRKDFQRIYQKVMGRLKDETHLFDNYIALGFWDEILAASFEKSDQNLKYATRKYTGMGNYSPDTDTAYVDMSPPSPESFLIAIAGRQTVPDSADLGVHETIHDYQYPESWLILQFYHVVRIATGDQIFAGNEFIETSAYRLTSFEPHEANPEQLADFIINSKNEKGAALYPGLSREKILASVSLIDQMQALGWNAKQIAQLPTTYSGWDEDAHDYKVLRDMVKKEATNQNVDYPDGVNLKIEQRREEMRRSRVSAQKIVLEELKHLSG